MILCAIITHVRMYGTIIIDAWLNLGYNLVTERSVYYADSSNERFKEYCRDRAKMF